MRAPDRGWAAQFAHNFTASPMPLPRRIYVTVRNISLRAIRRRACCGHDGEPGC